MPAIKTMGNTTVTARYPDRVKKPVPPPLFDLILQWKYRVCHARAGPIFCWPILHKYNHKDGKDSHDKSHTHH